MKKKIIIFEDNLILSEILSNHLISYLESCSIVKLKGNFSTSNLLEEKGVDLVLLNFQLLENNIKVLNKISKLITENIIIIYNNLEDRHKNKNFNKFKFLVKPFKLKNLFDIVNEFFTVFNSIDQNLKLSNRLVFKPKNKIIENKITKCSIYLTEKETELIQYLYDNKNNIITKKQILNNVWNLNEKVNTHTLETHLYRLRKKIEKIEEKISLSFFHQKTGYSLTHIEK